MGRMVITFPVKDVWFAEVPKCRNDRNKGINEAKRASIKLSEYVEQEKFFPNSVIIAFDKTVQFKKTSEDRVCNSKTSIENRFIIDGQ